jgi:hypothetical protein
MLAQQSSTLQARNRKGVTFALDEYIPPPSPPGTFVLGTKYGKIISELRNEQLRSRQASRNALGLEDLASQGKMRTA